MKWFKNNNFILRVIAVLAGLLVTAAVCGFLVFSHFYNMLDYRAADHESWTAGNEEWEIYDQEAGAADGMTGEAYDGPGPAEGASDYGMDSAAAATDALSVSGDSGKAGSTDAMSASDDVGSMDGLVRGAGSAAADSSGTDACGQESRTGGAYSGSVTPGGTLEQGNIPGSKASAGGYGTRTAVPATGSNYLQKKEDNNLDILLIGVDARDNSIAGRSDSMILVSINREARTITMTSFLRDIYCTIPGHRNNRLNTSFYFGGPALLMQTIEQNFGISADRYMVVNFYSVEELIDAMGGVDISLTRPELGVINKYIKEQNRLFGNASGTDYLKSSDAGNLLHLDGNQALAYARIRYVGTDFARTGRQREIISLLMDKVKDMSFLELMGMVEEFLPKVTTDLSRSDFASMLLVAMDLASYEVNSFLIPAEGTWSDVVIAGMQVLDIDFEANRDYWYKMVQQGSSPQ